MKTSLKLKGFTMTFLHDSSNCFNCSLTFQNVRNKDLHHTKTNYLNIKDVRVELERIDCNYLNCSFNKDLSEKLSSDIKIQEHDYSSKIQVSDDDKGDSPKAYIEKDISIQHKKKLRKKIFKKRSSKKSSICNASTPNSYKRVKKDKPENKPNLKVKKCKSPDGAVPSTSGINLKRKKKESLLSKKEPSLRTLNLIQWTEENNKINEDYEDDLFENMELLTFFEGDSDSSDMCSNLSTPDCPGISLSPVEGCSTPYEDCCTTEEFIELRSRAEEYHFRRCKRKKNLNKSQEKAEEQKKNTMRILSQKKAQKQKERTMEVLKNASKILNHLNDLKNEDSNDENDGHLCAGEECEKCS